MDGLGIENAISQANAMTTNAENARAAQSTLIRSIGIQNQKDKNAATDKIASDRNSFLAMDGFHGAETAWNLYNESGQTLKDFSDSTDTADFLGRQLKRSLAGDVGRGIDNVANNWISGAVNRGGPSLLGGGAAPSRRRNIQPKGQAGGAPADPVEETPFGRRLPGGVAEAPTGAGEFNSIGEGAEPIPDRTARLNRIFIQENQPTPAERQGLDTTSPATDSDAAIRTQTVTDVQETAAVNARGLSDAPLGNQLSHDTVNYGRTAAQQGAVNVEETTTPAPRPTTTPTTTTTTPTEPSTGPAAPDVPAPGADEDAGGKALAFLKKGQALAANPLVRGGMKVFGNIQGGEDIYDLMENRNKFDDGSDTNKSAAGFHEGAHILSSLGTIADVAGIFLPGAEELGAALNLTGSILDSVGDHEKDVSNASTVYTNASNALAAASKPITTSPALQSAGLIAGSATHQGASTGVSTF